jgi:hypothetical protein
MDHQSDHGTGERYRTGASDHGRVSDGRLGRPLRDQTGTRGDERADTPGGTGGDRR